MESTVKQAGRKKSMRKGEMTRATILEAALELASQNGIEGLTIGLLAEKMKMSKSGVFAHFGSREDLQIDVIRLYHKHFEEDVFYPSIQEPRGLPRLEMMFSRWLDLVTLEIARGCIYISGAVEYDDRPGEIRDELVEMIETWRAALERCVCQAIETGELRTDIDVAQIVYEMYGLILAVHHDARLLRRQDSVQQARRGFERLINNCRSMPTGPTGEQGTRTDISPGRKAA